ncbi:uncharacterized protein LOC112598839 [Melanaphis sacchari]|uniref:uncharacterized protein LOC112598839 n=1 Tax=Melanaphis sacchari TaxID=742174 RepID=UPI000DC13902|nr:uncharacterized protein LOC112598839 [Melanaphis sacchari]
MCTVCYFWFIACSLLMTNASILNDLQEAQKFMEQLDYDYSAVVADAAAAAAQQRPISDLLWYDYGGGGSSGVSGGVGRGESGGGGTRGASFYGTGSPATGVATAALFGADKRGGTTQSSNGGIWFGPRLGRRKRRGGSPFGGGGVAQSVDGNAIAPAASSLQDPLAAGSTSMAAEQAAVSNLINNMPWVLVPIIDNSLYNQIQMKQNARNGRSSEEDDDDDAASRSRHTARSPPYSPPFSPRLGRQAIMNQPQVPRLGRETLLYRRDARNALYQQSNATLLRQQRQQQQQQQLQASSLRAATESAAARHQAV